MARPLTLQSEILPVRNAENARSAESGPPGPGGDSTAESSRDPGRGVSPLGSLAFLPRSTVLVPPPLGETGAVRPRPPECLGRQRPDPLTHDPVNVSPIWVNL